MKLYFRDVCGSSCAQWFPHPRENVPHSPLWQAVFFRKGLAFLAVGFYRYMGRIIAIANQKGGVGKTTTAVNTAAALALAGRRVLLCDFDPQANATSGLGIEKTTLSRSVYDGLTGGVSAQELILRTRFCDVLPSSIALAGAEIELGDFPAREHALKRLLTPVSFSYDFILIDCPPSLGLLTLNALCAADTVLAPIQCEYYALEGLSQLMQTIRSVKRSLNPSLTLEGILLTMFDSRTNLSQQVVHEVKKHFPRQVFPVVIPRNVRLSEAPSHGVPVMYYDRSSKGAKCYEKLAECIIQN